MVISTGVGSRRGVPARLRGGPDDGAVIEVAPLPDGSPPDFFHAGPTDSGMYVLAGMPHDDGAMPYWWVSSAAQAAPANVAHDATWTLLSLHEDGRSVTIWHQHGDGAEPIRLHTEPLRSSQLPAFVGREYVCPDCGDVAVLSLPPG